MRREKRHVLRVAGLAVLLACLWCFPAFADGWVPLENGEWKYEENGEFAASGWRQVDGTWYYFGDDGLMLTGWVQAADDGLWYYLDTQTGAWVRRPSLSDETVVKLLDNAIMKAGYYQDEEGEVYLQVDWRDESIIYASLRQKEGPNDMTTLNTYEIHKKTGNVTAAAGGNFNIYS